MDELSTERLALRAWTPDDIDFAFDLYSRWEVQQFIGTTPRVMTERAEAVAQVERFMALDHPVQSIWLITDRAGGRLGTLLLKSIPASGPTVPLEPSGETEIGWHLHPDAWGHGYATEAAGRVLAHAFVGGLERVVAVTHADNLASQRVARRIGMEHHGSTDRFYNTTCELFVAVADLGSDPSASFGRRSAAPPQDASGPGQWTGTRRHHPAARSPCDACDSAASAAS